MIDNPHLIEEFPRDYERTQFEKIRVAAKRAKDLHDGGKIPLVDSTRTSPYIALKELNAGVVLIVTKEEESPAMLEEDLGEEE